MGNMIELKQGWRFMRADAFPMAEAVEKHRDAADRSPLDRDYDDGAWEEVTVPHTFNDADLFSVPIEDGGSGQRRTAAFYRYTLRIPPEHRGKRVYIAFEGVRQTCYLYVNGRPAGYTEMGVGPFGFDLTPWIDPDGPNVLAAATDNTGTRNIPFCIAETPNRPGAVPGSYLQSQDVRVDEKHEGVGFSWNCNDFNPTVGGLSRPVRIYFKKDVHLTLPLYANLRTRGTYIYADGFDHVSGTARVHAEAEVMNLSPADAVCRTVVTVRDMEGREKAGFSSGEIPVPSSRARLKDPPPLSIVPEDAYVWDEARGKYIPAAEEKAYPETASAGSGVVSASAGVRGLTFWEPACPALYRVTVTLFADGEPVDTEEIVTGFREVAYDRDRGVLINGHPVWLRGYAQRAANEWAAAGIVPQWMHDLDAALIRESGANHIRFMHVAGSSADLRAFDRYGIICTQPAGDKERETFGRQWEQRAELMRNVLIACRNHPCILFWEAGNNVISTGHMREMRLLREELDPHGGRFMGCRTINTEDTLNESEYVGTMLNRHAARFLAEHGPVTETEYSREEAPRRVWDDYTPPDFDYRCKWLGKGGRKQKGRDFYDLTGEDLALANARGYAEFFNDRIGGDSGKNLYSACAALCWTDSAQHGRQSWSENGRMSGRVDAIRVKKQSFDLFRVMHSAKPAVMIIGHWNYPPDEGDNYRFPEKRFNGSYWQETGSFGRRDPRRKTVYCAASYPVKRVEMRVNGRTVGSCDRPESTFLFPFPGIDITESGAVEAVGYDTGGCPVCSDRIETAGKASALRLTVRVAPGGWRADGGDLAMADVSVTDAEGRVCPLDDRRITFETSGDAVFLGGYNSGRFDGNGREDNVIHKDHVYAECGVNRVLLRAGTHPGSVTLTASAEGLPGASVTLETVPAGTPEPPRTIPEGLSGRDEYLIPQIPGMDKYVPEKENWCKIMVNGQEPDFRGVRAVNKNGCVWGNVLCILERMRSQRPDLLDFDWDAAEGKLTVTTAGRTVTARVGETHLNVDGQENLMDGAPYVTEEGILVMEVAAAASQVAGAAVQYDDRIGALRVTL